MQSPINHLLFFHFIPPIVEQSLIFTFSQQVNCIKKKFTVNNSELHLLLKKSYNALLVSIQVSSLDEFHHAYNLVHIP